MSSPSLVAGDLVVQGNLRAYTFSPPASSVTDSAVATGAGISALKLQQQRRSFYAQPNTSATSITIPLFLCHGATGQVIDFSAGNIAKAVGAATVTFDLQKNGTTVLSAMLTLNSSSPNYSYALGTLAGTTNLAVGDVLTAVIMATAGGGTLPTGIYCAATIQEDPQ